MAYVYPCVSCVSVELYVPSLRCHRLVLRPVKAMLDRNFRCTVTEYKSNHSSGAEHESDVTAHLYHRVRGASPLGDGHKSRS